MKKVTTPAKGLPRQSCPEENDQAYVPGEMGWIFPDPRPWEADQYKDLPSFRCPS